MDNVQKGDLIHIPQGVFLLSERGSAHHKTDRPRTALFLGETSMDKWGLECHGRILLDGKEFNVRTDHIYILKEQEKKSSVS